jgi:hypothetical protein
MAILWYETADPRALVKTAVLRRACLIPAVARKRLAPAAWRTEVNNGLSSPWNWCTKPAASASVKTKDDGRHDLRSLDCTRQRTVSPDLTLV